MENNRYEIKEVLGKGGVGAVYLAYDKVLNREVALKRMLSAEELGQTSVQSSHESLLQEAKALSALTHPNIVTIYDTGTDESGVYVVMELINGLTLDEMIEKGSLTFDDFKEVAMQSLEAMIAAQDLDFLHRDLKPSNLMINWLPSGKFQVKIVDFGLAKFTPKPEKQTVDHGDAVFGSIFFMAPEQFERKPLDQRTDMYSLGALFYFSLTGNCPFDGDTAPEVMASHLMNRVEPLQNLRPDLPTWLCDWVMWFISREPADRPSSAREALENFLIKEGTAPATSGLIAQNQSTSGVIFEKDNLVQTRNETPSLKTAPQPLRSNALADDKNIYHKTRAHNASFNNTTTNIAANDATQVNNITIAKDINNHLEDDTKSKNFIKITMLVVACLVISIITWLIVANLSTDNAQDDYDSAVTKYEKYIKGINKEVKLTENEVLALFHTYHASNNSRVRNTAVLVLNKAVASFDLDYKLAELILADTKLLDKQLKLLRVLRKRKSSTITPLFLQKIKTNEIEVSRDIAFLLKSTASESELERLLDIYFIKQKEGSSDAKNLKDVIASLVKKYQDNAIIVSWISDALTNSKNNLALQKQLVDLIQFATYNSFFDELFKDLLANKQLSYLALQKLAQNNDIKLHLYEYRNLFDEYIKKLPVNNSNKEIIELFSILNKVVDSTNINLAKELKKLILKTDAYSVKRKQLIKHLRQRIHSKDVINRALN